MLARKKESCHVMMNVSRYETPREKSKRPQLSCNSCRLRKVKCDRLQPCSACSLHQISEQCEYDLSEAERKPILQAEALRAKDREIAWLRAQIARLGGGSNLADTTAPDARKKRKAGNPATPRHGARSSSCQESRSSAFQPASCSPTSPHGSPDQCEQTQSSVRQSPVSQPGPTDLRVQATRPYKRTKPPIKSIAIPAPGDSRTVAMRGMPSWSDSDLIAAMPRTASGFTRAFPNTAPSFHCTDGITPEFKQERLGGDGEQLVLTHRSTRWPTCFSSGTEALYGSFTSGTESLPISSTTNPSYLSYAPMTSAVAASLTYSSLHTPSTASYPPSACPLSTSGSTTSLHTPCASHPVSPTLSQSQPYRLSQASTQPPSPEVWFDGGGGSVHGTGGFDLSGTNASPQHHHFGDGANSAALIAEMAGAGEKDGGLGTWQWKMAWGT